MLASVLSLLVSLITPALIQYLKSQPWMPFIRHNAPVLNALVAGAIAVAQTVGIAVAFDAGTLTISGINPVNNAIVAATAALAWLVQEITYRTTVRR